MFTSTGGTNWTIEEQSVNWFDCLDNFQNKKAWCGASGGRIWYAVYFVGISGNTNEIPGGFKLSQNYPNPFNPTTIINFSIPLLPARRIDNGGGRGVSEGWGVFVNLRIFDVLGREIQTLINEKLSAGTYEVDFDGTSLPSGIYFYKITAGDFTDTKKMILAK
jgi:hypothetical protein